jgi:hypothetical protein
LDRGLCAEIPDAADCTIYAVAQPGTVCRPAAGGCDVSETCNDTGRCPPDIHACCGYSLRFTAPADRDLDGPHSNFPLLVSHTDSSLRSTTRGGRVGTEDGSDIFFVGVGPSTCNQPSSPETTTCTLQHEIERYDPTAGELVAWVSVPALANGSTIELVFGGCPRPGGAADATAVWTAAGYAGVWHFAPRGPTPTHLWDSTVAARHGTDLETSQSAVATQGRVGPACELDGADCISIPDTADSLLKLATQFTVSLWFRPNTLDHQLLVWQGPANADGWADECSGFGCSGDLYAPELHLAVGHFEKTNEACNGMPDGGGLFFADRNACAFTVGDTLDVHAVGLAAGTWHYVAAVVGGLDESPTGALYHDWQTGALGPPLPVSATDAIGLSRFGWTKPLRFGCADVPNVRQFAGRLDEVRVSLEQKGQGWLTTEQENQARPASFYTVGPLQRIGAQ